MRGKIKMDTLERLMPISLSITYGHHHDNVWSDAGSRSAREEIKMYTFKQREIMYEQHPVIMHGPTTAGIRERKGEECRRLGLLREIPPLVS